MVHWMMAHFGIPVPGAPGASHDTWWFKMDSLSGWWLTYPSEKYESQFPQYMEK